MSDGKKKPILSAADILEQEAGQHAEAFESEPLRVAEEAKASATSSELDLSAFYRKKEGSLPGRPGLS